MENLSKENFCDLGFFSPPSETVKRDVGEFIFCRYCNLLQLNSIGLHLHCFVCPLRYAMIIVVPWKYIIPSARMKFSHIRKKKLLYPFGINLTKYAIFYSPEFYQCGHCDKVFDRAQIFIHVDICSGVMGYNKDAYLKEDFSYLLNIGERSYNFPFKLLLTRSKNGGENKVIPVDCPENNSFVSKSFPSATSFNYVSGSITESSESNNKKNYKRYSFNPIMINDHKLVRLLCAAHLDPKMSEKSLLNIKHLICIYCGKVFENSEKASEAKSCKGLINVKNKEDITFTDNKKKNQVDNSYISASMFSLRCGGSIFQSCLASSPICNLGRDHSKCFRDDAYRWNLYSLLRKPLGYEGDDLESKHVSYLGSIFYIHYSPVILPLSHSSFSTYKAKSLSLDGDENEKSNSSEDVGMKNIEREIEKSISKVELEEKEKEKDNEEEKDSDYNNYHSIIHDSQMIDRGQKLLGLSELISFPGLGIGGMETEGNEGVNNSSSISSSSSVISLRTAIRFALSQNPHPLSPFFTLVENNNDSEYSSLLSKNSVHYLKIVGGIKAIHERILLFLRLSMKERKKRWKNNVEEKEMEGDGSEKEKLEDSKDGGDLFLLEGEDAIKASVSIYQCIESRNYVLFAASRKKEGILTLEESKEGQSDYNKEIVLIELHVSDEDFFRITTLEILRAMLAELLGLQDKAHRRLGLIVSPSFIRVVRAEAVRGTQKHSTNQLNISLRLGVSEALEMGRGGLWYWWNLLLQPLDFFETETVIDDIINHSESKKKEIKKISEVEEEEKEKKVKEEEEEDNNKDEKKVEVKNDNNAYAEKKDEDFKENEKESVKRKYDEIDKEGSKENEKNKNSETISDLKIRSKLDGKEKESKVKKRIVKRKSFLRFYKKRNMTFRDLTFRGGSCVAYNYIENEENGDDSNSSEEESTEEEDFEGPNNNNKLNENLIILSNSDKNNLSISYRPEKVCLTTSLSSFSPSPISDNWLLSLKHFKLSSYDLDNSDFPSVCCFRNVSLSWYRKYLIMIKSLTSLNNSHYIKPRKRKRELCNTSDEMNVGDDTDEGKENNRIIIDNINSDEKNSVEKIDVNVEIKNKKKKGEDEYEEKNGYSELSEDGDFKADELEVQDGVFIKDFHNLNSSSLIKEALVPLGLAFLEREDSSTVKERKEDDSVFIVCPLKTNISMGELREIPCILSPSKDELVTNTMGRTMDYYDDWRSEILKKYGESFINKVCVGRPSGIFLNHYHNSFYSGNSRLTNNERLQLKYKINLYQDADYSYPLFEQLCRLNALGLDYRGVKEENILFWYRRGKKFEVKKEEKDASIIKEYDDERRFYLVDFGGVCQLNMPTFYAGLSLYASKHLLKNLICHESSSDELDNVESFLKFLSNKYYSGYCRYNLFQDFKDSSYSSLISTYKNYRINRKLKIFLPFFCLVHPKIFAEFSSNSLTWFNYCAGCSEDEYTSKRNGKCTFFDFSKYEGFDYIAKYVYSVILMRSSNNLKKLINYNIDYSKYEEWHWKSVLYFLNLYSDCIAVKVVLPSVYVFMDIIKEMIGKSDNNSSCIPLEKLSTDNDNSKEDNLESSSSSSKIKNEEINITEAILDKYLKNIPLKNELLPIVSGFMFWIMFGAIPIYVALGKYEGLFNSDPEGYYIFREIFSTLIKFENFKDNKNDENEEE